MDAWLWPTGEVVSILAPAFAQPIGTAGVYLEAIRAMLARAMVNIIMPPRVYLDKIQSAVDLGLIDEHTGFTCWFVESAPHLIRWPERKELPDRPIRKGGPMPSLASQLVRAPGGP